MKNFRFNREEDNRWYVVLPEWTGSKEDLEMVCGADTMLDILSQGADSVNVSLSTEPFQDYKYMLSYLNESNEGGDYLLTSDLLTFDVWLCHVTKFVFGNFPKRIYLA